MCPACAEYYRTKRRWQYPNAQLRDDALPVYVEETVVLIVDMHVRRLKPPAVSICVCAAVGFSAEIADCSGMPCHVNERQFGTASITWRVIGQSPARNLSAAKRSLADHGRQTDTRKLELTPQNHRTVISTLTIFRGEILQATSMSATWVQYAGARERMHRRRWPTRKYSQIVMPS